MKMESVEMGNHNFRIPLLKNIIEKKIRSRGVQEYKLNDLQAEIAIFFNTIYKNFDIIHFLDAEHSLMFLPYWFKMCRFLGSFPRIIAMFHQPPEVLKTLINPEIVKQVDCILVVSPDQMDYFGEFLPPERIRMILHGVDTDYFKPDAAKKGHANFRCLAGGVWLRNYDALFETADILRNHKEIEFHIISSDISLPENAGNIFIHSNISDSELLNLYQSSDVMFMPLKAATANNLLLEGIACGLPVVSTDLESINAYFPGEESILVKDNNPEEFAEVILDLYQKPYQRLEAMSLKARVRAEELSWVNIVKDYKNFYANI